MPDSERSRSPEAPAAPERAISLDETLAAPLGELEERLSGCCPEPDETRPAEEEKTIAVDVGRDHDDGGRVAEMARLVTVEKPDGQLGQTRHPQAPGPYLWRIRPATIICSTGEA